MLAALCADDSGLLIVFCNGFTWACSDVVCVLRLCDYYDIYETCGPGQHLKFGQH